MVGDGARDAQHGPPVDFAPRNWVVCGGNDKSLSHLVIERDGAANSRNQASVDPCDGLNYSADNVARSTNSADALRATMVLTTLSTAWIVASTVSVETP